MDTTQNKKKEGFKTGLIAGLFILSLALNQQAWFNTSFDKMIPLMKRFSTIEEKINTIAKEDMADIVNPQSFSINFGGGLHTVLYAEPYDVWKKTIDILKTKHSENKISVHEVEKDEWQEASKFRSITMDFGYDISRDLLMEILEIKEAAIFKKTSDIDSIVISLMEDMSIYMGNKKDQSYYRIDGIDHEYSFSKIIKDIEDSKYEVYYPMNDIYGVENDTLMQMSTSDNVHQLEVEQEIIPTNEGQAESFAGTFFGDNLDFIRKIKEASGSVIYMYGYGQKVLRLEETGVLEYIEEMDTQKPEINTSLVEALKIARKFVREHGSWSNIDAHLRGINVIKNGKGYEFLFGYRLNGIPIYMDEEGKKEEIVEPIEVQVVGKQVIYYKRILKREKNTISFLDAEEDLNIIPSSEIIDINFNAIKDDYLAEDSHKNQKIDEKDISQQVLREITSVEIGYLDYINKESEKLMPIWIIKTNKKVYYFDAYSGEMINGFER
ncbi:hypothetical protein IZY60_02125 [Lutibacter sp. B2]|nr:hypothetical protein [Lutibacter sp. B2]